MKRPLLFLSLFAICHAAVAETPLFNGKDLAGWQQPVGTWSAVSKVTLDPAAPNHFVATPGEGILLNSASSHTVDALTKMEHRDCQLHVEFCVPKGSNSG